MSTQEPPVIAIDAMGGDIGLDVTLTAIALIQKRHNDVHILIVGDENAIRAHKAFPTIDDGRIRVRHTSQVVAMDEAPASVLRHKTDSSMWKAIEAVRDGDAQACVSAGNTGALMASSRYILKMLPGISRPAICAVVPSRGGHVHWLDLGANVDAKPEQLVQFAVMGSELVKAVDEKAQPIVGLLNIGEEAIKGNDIVKETSKLLEQTSLNYCGFVGLWASPLRRQSPLRHRFCRSEANPTRQRMHTSGPLRANCSQKAALPNLSSSAPCRGLGAGESCAGPNTDEYGARGSSAAIQRSSRRE